LRTIKLQVPEQCREQYLKVILKNYEAKSQDELELGRADTFMHKISLKTPEPIYIKQF